MEKMVHAFEPSANSRLGVRRDRVGWVATRPDIEENSTQDTSPGLLPGPHLTKVLRKLEGIVQDLNDNSNSGVCDLLLPYQAMIGSYVEGGFFQAHKDNEPRSRGDGEGSSTVWANPREVTAVLYINEGEAWEEAFGGCLKCYGTGSTSLISPNGGRLVIFKSRELLHEVTSIKPGSAGLPRLAITLWAMKKHLSCGS